MLVEEQHAPLKSTVPTFSLCIPAYQAEAFIATAVESCLAQTESPHEILLSDDFSSDATRAIIERFRGAPRVRIIYPKHHLGLGGHYLHVLNAATGSHVTILSSDDALHPEFVAHAREGVERAPDLGLLAFGGFRCDARMRPTTRFGLSYPQSLMEPPEGCRRFLLGCSYLISFSVWNRAMLLSLPILPDEAGLTTDWYWAMVVGARAPVQLSRRPLGYYRFHDQNASHSNETRSKAHAEQMRRFLIDQHILPEPLERDFCERRGAATEPSPTWYAAKMGPFLRGIVNRVAATVYLKHPLNLR